MKYIRLFVVFFLSFLSIVTSDFSIATNGHKRSAEGEFGGQSELTRPRYQEEEEEYDEKEEECDEDEDIEDVNEDQGYQEEIESFIDDYEDLSQDEKDQKLLEAASENLAEVEALLALEANINVKSTPEKYGVTPLYRAAEAGRLDIVALLLKNRSLDVNAAATGDLAGATPLWVAVLNGHTGIVRRLLEDAEVTVAIDNPGATVKELGLPLSIAIDRGNVDLVELLLEAGADKDIIVNNKFPLFEAISQMKEGESIDDNAYTKIAKLLVEFGANVNQAVPHNAEEEAGWTALRGAVAADAYNLVNSLINAGADLEAQMLDEYSRGETPLYKAVYYGHSNIVRLLLDKGANILVTSSGSEGDKTLFYTAKEELENEKTDDFRKIYNMLLNAFEKDPRKADQQGNTELHNLVGVNNDIANSVIKDLLARGGDLLIKNNAGKSALSKAVEHQNKEVIKLFLDPIEDEDSDRALLVAIENGLLSDVARLLKREGVDANAEKNSVTPLMIATQQSASVSLMVMDQLLKAGAEIDKIDNNGKTALAYAAEAGKSQAFRWLLAKQASLDALSNVTLTEKMQKVLDEHQRQDEKGGAEKEGIIDVITQEDITDFPADQKIRLGSYTYLKKSIMDYILSQVGFRNLDSIIDPLRSSIGQENIESLAKYFSIPVEQLNTPALNANISQFPEGLDRQAYVEMYLTEPSQTLSKFKEMIASDTIRSLYLRLRFKESRLQTYQEGDTYEDGRSVWQPGERTLTEREVEALKEAIKNKLLSFGYSQE